MPLQSTVAQVRLNNTITCLTAALTILDIISDTFGTPFLGAITSTTQSLMQSVQTVKRNKNDCAQLMEKIYGLLSGIIVLHTKSGTSGELSPNMLYHVGKFAETLHKIHVFVEAQHDGNRIKQFFRQSEMSALLKDCNTGLKEALDIFKLQGVSVLNDVTDMQRDAQKTHHQVLELIKSLSEEGSSDEASSMNRVLSSSNNSSNSLSMLPSEPKIFHGRGSEVDTILKAFAQEAPRIAILGAGRMGKTSLARAVLHHSEIIAIYEQHRFFVACDTVSTCIELGGWIGSHLGLKPGKDLTRAVVHYFSNSLPCLLILDNLETLWEPTESRGAVEEFLSLLTDVPHLALIITMRGAERPAQVRCTRPFLLPLKPLTEEASQQIFIDITDDTHDSKDVSKPLLLADNLPLAVDLLAHLVDYEGCANVLSRWEGERTSLLSEGYDKRSNLDLSISVSLSSPRITSLPHAEELLSLLSILSDGLSDIELLQSKLPFENILVCKAALLRTSLAYTDDQRRLKTLVPIREYMQKNHPPMVQVVEPLLKYFQELLDVYKTYAGTLASAGVVARITSNFTNIQNILLNGLHQHNPDLVTIIHSSISLDAFGLVNSCGQSLLMDRIPDVLPQPCDHTLEVAFITEIFNSQGQYPIHNPEALIGQALEHFDHIHDPKIKCESSN
ncbi:hypothetical protein C8R44DRAFT_928520 [Mycena epipterygia]|nr:hypothetical protein C8R44DRAFT_928520 [Mycena epipterygia]